MLGFMVQLLQQFSGINAVMYFAPVIFKKFLASNMVRRPTPHIQRAGGRGRGSPHTYIHTYM